MNAPYDGDRGQAADGSGHPQGPPPDPGQTPPQPPADMYLQDAYDQDPYRAQDLSAQDPVSEALYDRAAPPPPPPGTYPPQQPLYSQPSQSPYAPDPRVWAQTPAPEPEGPTQYLPYGDDPRTTQFVGVDDLVGQAGDQRHEPDAFAHLFRDQQQGGGHPSYDDQAAVPAPAPAPGPYGGAAGPGQYGAPPPPPPGQYGGHQGPDPYGNAQAHGQYGGP
ncbi:murein biosynthesis integral membrane protein MurJ, partial [Streptomyces sp. SID5926]|nr:murein biosynthesis integral membrane protein MurJ [Streptomyces sp. SID5926]